MEDVCFLFFEKKKYGRLWSRGWKIAVAGVVKVANDHKHIRGLNMVV